MENFDLDEQIANILDEFPGSSLEKEAILNVPLFPKTSITIDLRKYPKKPKIILPKSFKRAFGGFEYFLPLYRNWDPKKPVDMIQILQGLQRGFETIAGKKVHFSDKIIQDICYMAKTSYPKEFFCLLRIVNGVLHEYVIAPGMESSAISAVFFPSRIRGDNTLIATCHSHPTPNYHPSRADLRTFKNFYVNIIIGAPFNVSTLGVYNFKGEPIPFEVHIVNFLEHDEDQESFSI
ncbi:MAG: Mov34/MPN/PAD-1 family protein [Candidatus Lokiarchaeota archaeon]|nr:Mov34/MPN/PAD-1 family protein [Candidatus Harpocratesius repetitus]